MIFKYFSPEIELLIEEKCDFAITHFGSIINNSEKTDQEKSQAYLNRATCYMKTYKFVEAINDIKSCINLNKTNSKAHRQLAMCYMINDNVSESKKTLTELINNCNDEKEKQLANQQLKDYADIEIKEKEANVAYEKEDYQTVIELMDDCMEIKNICVRHKILKATSLIYIMKFEEALMVINEVLFSDKDDIEAISIRGLNLIYQGKYKLGIEDIRQTIYDSPQSRIVYETYKDCEELIMEAKSTKNNKNFEKALEIFTKILNKDPKNLPLKMEMYFEIAEIEFLQKKYQEALQNVNNALKICEDEIKALKLRGQIYSQLKKYTEAVQDYKHLLKLSNTTEHNDLLKDTESKLKNLKK